MRLSVTVAVGLLGSLGVASPVERQGDMALTVSDTDALNYALVLEFLELKFYSDGLKNYTEKDFTSAGFLKEFYKNIKQVALDEQAHVNALIELLGPMAINEPEFAFPVNNVHSFVGLVSVLEGVGVSAYSGAASKVPKSVLEVAALILPVEARHAAIIRATRKLRPIPVAFDVPLSFNQVYSLAASFVKSFAPGTKLPFKPFPALVAKSSAKDAKYCAGKGTVIFKGAQTMAKTSGKVAKDAKVFVVFYSGKETYYVRVEGSRKGKDYTAKIPGAGYARNGQARSSGQTYVTLSTADGEDAMAGDNNTIAGPALVEIEC